MPNLAISPFLRGALIADAAVSGGAALLMLAGAGLLTGLLGLPAEFLRAADLLLVPFVAFVAWIGTRRHAPEGAVWSVIGLNVLWVAASVLILVGGIVQPTLLGYAFVVAQAAAVALFAELQYIGLKREATPARA